MQRDVRYILVGESGVGKTSIMERFVNDRFVYEGNESTIGIDCASKYIRPDTRILIWDTAGQERFRSIISSFFRNVDVALLVFDVSNRKSFDEICEYWLPYVRRHCQRHVYVAVVAMVDDFDLGSTFNIS